MLENTFCHASGIGPKSESQLWAAGLHTWSDLVDCDKPPMAARQAAALRDLARDSMARLDAGDPDYFYQKLPAAQHWRLFPHFRHTVAYLDIETTGLGTPDDYITSIVLYDGRVIRHYVQGGNLLDFKDDVEQYRLLSRINEGATSEVARGGRGDPPSSFSRPCTPLPTPQNSSRGTSVRLAGRRRGPKLDARTTGS